MDVNGYFFIKYIFIEKLAVIIFGDCDFSVLEEFSSIHDFG